MARVLIAGCGYVGAAAARYLLAEGHEVWTLRRSTIQPPEGARAIVADLTDPSSLVTLPPGLDFVLYTAAASGRDDKAYKSAYVDGVGHLVDALAARRETPKRILFTSSTGVYGQSAGEWVDETSPTEPTGFTGRRVLEGERKLLGGPFPATVVRLGGIYGPGRERLVASVRSGLSRIEHPRRYTNRIHREDAASILIHCMGLSDPANVYVGVDLEPATTEIVVRWLARELEVPEPPVDPQTAAEPYSNKRCSSVRLKDSGYRFRFPTFRSGYRSVIALVKS